jgi:hypothetical protein
MGQKKSILYYDLESSGNWKVNPEERSEIKSFCHDYFENAVRQNNCDEINRDLFRGDDGIAYFNTEDDCANAAISFFESISEMIRRCPHLECEVNLKPRIILFNDTISGGTYGDYSGRHMESILPKEKSFGKVGTIRIVGTDLWFELPGKTQMRFPELPDIFEGKTGTKYEGYEYDKKIDVDRIRSKHVAPFFLIPSHLDQVYKFFSNNLTSRNSITIGLMKAIKESSKFPNKLEFIKAILISCRGYLEMTVSATKPKSTDWNFKMSYWEFDKTKKSLSIIAYCYPENMRCICYDERISLKPGENLVGRTFRDNRTYVQLTLDADYVPMHDKRDPGIAAIAAFTVTDLEGFPVGVLSIDSRHSIYFSGEENLRLHEQFLSSFTVNLALSEYLP